MIRLLTLFVLSIFLLPSTIQSQDYTFNDLYDFDLVNMGEINSDGSITGYYLFYETDRIDRKTQNYKLIFLDTDLQEIKSLDKVGSRDIKVIDAAYNGNALIIKFYDKKKRELFYEIYDNEANLVYDKAVKITKQEIALYTKKNQMTGSIMPLGLSSVTEKGFIDIGIKKANGLKYEIRFFSSEDENDYWTFMPHEKGFESAGFLAANDSQICLMTYWRKNIMSQSVEAEIVTLNVNDGSLQKRLTIDDFDNAVFTKGYLTQEGKLDLIGLYFESNDNIFKDHSLGLVNCQLTETGDLLGKRTMPWGKLSNKSTSSRKTSDSNSRRKKSSKRKKSSSSKKRKGNEKSKKVDFFFHDFVKLEDGRIFAIAEEFRKKADGLGIAIAVLGGDASLVEIRIEDMIIAEITPDFNLGPIEKFAKKHEDFDLPQGSAFVSSALLGFIVDQYGGFMHQYTQEIKGDDGYFYTAYIDYGKGKSNPGAYKFAAYIDGQFVEDEISMESDASDMYVFKAKPGHVLIVEYFKKDKSLKLKLEPLNF